MVHKHNWELIDKEVVPGKKFGRFNAEGYIAAKMVEMMQDRVIHTFKCPCGQVKVIKN